MKTNLLVALMFGVVFAGPAAPALGTRVIPPSQKGYTVESIRAAGERGGTIMSLGTNFTAAHNREMGEAIELWNAHRWAEGVAAFRNIYLSSPGSPWAAEAELHEACYLNYNARYDEAEERFLSVLRKYPESAEMRNKVLRYLPHLYAQTGRIQTGIDLLDELKKLPLGWQERQFAENYERIYARAESKDDQDRRCGTKALALALAAQNDKGESLRNVSLESVYRRHAWAGQKAAHPQGYSLGDLAGFGNGQVLELDLAALRAALRPGHPVLAHLNAPAEPKCFTVFAKKARAEAKPLSGHFVVVETVASSYVDLLDPDAGRVRWPLAHFQYRWSGAVLRLPGQEGVNGRALAPAQAQTLRGGCCGSPPPDPSDECDGGDSDSDSGGGGSGGWGDGIRGIVAGGLGGGGSCSSCGGGGGECCEQTEEGQESDPQYSGGGVWAGFGSPRYHFGLSSANFKLKDIPLWGTDAKGPRLNLQLIYNRIATQRMATNAGANYYAFGNKWSCNLFSHLTLSPDGASDF
ncbi:MAG: hypothetical protein MUF81_07595, partial [Verrucomicrobia bacterium]|nr:hypothetical protein [Verrucomicrobiota bacterium]